MKFIIECVQPSGQLKTVAVNAWTEEDAINQVLAVAPWVAIGKVRDAPLSYYRGV